MKKLKRIIATTIEVRSYIVNAVGFLTFFFGFASSAILNLYLLAINHSLVYELRSTLSYKSAVLGDGIILPIVNMIAASFILRNQELITRRIIQQALILGAIITIWFHVNQAAQNLVNWAMPQPWNWNFLGLWHAIYMFIVASFICGFYLLVFKKLKNEKEVTRHPLFVTIGLVLFFILLRLDYIWLDLLSFIPR